MIAVLQRVSSGSVTIRGKLKAKIQSGMVILLGVVKDDSDLDAKQLATKISKFRMFNDEREKMNLSIRDIGGSVLVISQFTLCGDVKKGRRPSFLQAAPPEEGKRLYKEFKSQLSAIGIPVESGEFGATMSVSMINEGPVTFVLNTQG
jgi:D-tyrosyl-tRNA(Tyr) deacylase